MKKFFSSVLCLALAGMNVSAQVSIDAISVDYAERRITITGKTDALDQRIGLYVSSGDDSAAFLQQMPESGGEYSFTAGLDRRFVDHELDVKVSQLGEETVCKNVYLYTQKDISEWLGEINSATDATTLREATEAKFDTVLKNLVNAEEVNTYSNEIYRLLLNFKKTYTVSVDEYAEDIKKAIAVAKVNSIGETELKEYFKLSENRALLGIENEPIDTAYERILLYRANKALAETIDGTGAGFMSPNEVSLAVCEADAIARINAAKAAEVRGILKEYEAVFEKVSTDFAVILADVNEVTARAVTGTAVTSLSEIITKLRASIAAQRVTDSELSGDNGYKGGGGGSPVRMDGSLATAAPEIKAESNSDYLDMQGYEWAEEAVSELSKLGVINGTGDGCFAPGNYISREEFIKMAVVLLGSYDSSAECEFADVKKDDWFYPYVASAVKAGICEGNGGGFGAGEKITRQDLTTVLGRALASYGTVFTASDDSFTDKDSISGYAREYVDGFKALGLISGMPDGSFMPIQNATRAESAVIIYNVYKFMRGK